MGFQPRKSPARWAFNSEYRKAIHRDRAVFPVARVLNRMWGSSATLCQDFSAARGVRAAEVSFMATLQDLYPEVPALCLVPRSPTTKQLLNYVEVSTGSGDDPDS